MWPIHLNQDWVAAGLFVAALGVVLALQFWLVASGRLRMPYDLVDPDVMLWTGDDDHPLLRSLEAWDPRPASGGRGPARSEPHDSTPGRPGGPPVRPGDGSSEDAA